jgi:hypothetical protein
MTWRTMRSFFARIVVAAIFLLGLIIALRPLSFAQQNAAAHTGKIQWIHYNDSAEGAFNMDVPLGWQIQGGMYRFGYFDVRWMMGARSLDGKVVILVNDVNVPPYVVPGPRTPREGQPYSKPQQFQMVVEKFQEPQAYAEVYAKHRFGDICKSMVPGTAKWKLTFPAAWRDPNGRSSEGAVSYNCESSDGARIATVATQNTLFQGQGYAFWVATPVSILCAPDRCEQAMSITQHMMDSWQKNDKWVQYQNQMTQAGLDQIRASFGQFMQQMQQFHQQFTQSMNQQVAGYYAHQDAQARQVSSWCDTINGVTNVTDPQTGNQFQVWTGPKSNYYVNGLGVKVNSNISPGPDFHQLEVNQDQ